MTTMEDVMKKPLPKWMVRTQWGAFEYYGIIDYSMLKLGILMLFTPDERLLCALSPGSWQQFSAIATDETGSEYYPVDRPNWGPTGSEIEQIAEGHCSDQPPEQTPPGPATTVLPFPGRSKPSRGPKEPPPSGDPAA